MINQLFESGSTIFFAVSIVLVFCISIGMGQDKKRKHKHFIDYAPTLMTSLGILGTFWGIVVGLLEFDTSNIDKSIPLLLSGLKTAFISSIFGMLATILFNTINSWLSSEQQSEQETKEREINSAIIAQTELLEKINYSLSVTEEGALAGDIKLLRTELSERNHEFSVTLWEKLEEFSSTLSQSATEQIIEALRTVVSDFNANLVGQFGENFKALELSVKKLVDWQDAYKEQLILMDSQFKQNVESLNTSEKSLAEIERHCKAIPEAMTDLRLIITTNQNQISELGRHLEAFIMMRDQAITAVPKLCEQVEIVSGLTATSIDHMQGFLEQSGQRLQANIGGINQLMENSIEQMRGILEKNQEVIMQLDGAMKLGLSSLDIGTEKIRAQLSSGNEKIHNVMDECFNKLQKSMSDYTFILEKQADKSVTTFNETLKKQHQAFESAAEQEITHQINVMGKALLQISQGFVNNYDQLAKTYEGVMSQQKAKLNDMGVRS